MRCFARARLPATMPARTSTRTLRRFTSSPDARRVSVAPCQRAALNWTGRYALTSMQRRAVGFQAPMASGDEAGDTPQSQLSTGAPSSQDGTADSQAAAVHITWLGLGANVLLSVGKGFAGSISGSAAMTADAVHSLSDTVSDIVVLFTMRLTRRPADEQHPYGYGRSEPLGTLLISGLVALAGAGMGQHSFEALRLVLDSSEGAAEMMNAPVALAAAIASVAVKEALYHLTIKIGRECHSSVLVANAWHHRTDAFSSVVALFGIAGHYVGMPALDPVAGGIVGLMVMRMGCMMAWDAVQELMDAQCIDADELAEIRTAAVSSSPDILDIHELRCRVVGPTLFVDLHAVVPGRLSISAAHHAEVLLRRNVKAVQPRVADVMVHLESSIGGDREHSHDISDEFVREQAQALISAEFPQVTEITSLVCHFMPDNKLEIEMAIRAPSLEAGQRAIVGPWRAEHKRGDRFSTARSLADRIDVRLRERIARVAPDVQQISTNVWLDLSTDGLRRSPMSAAR